MWKLLEQAAKTATANASEYVSTVQEKAQTLVATVQDEAATLLQAIGSARTGPVDELLYEEMEDYKAFCDTFRIDNHTDEISKILEDDDEIRGFHEQMVPVQISYEEFWSRYFFRHEQEELHRQQEEERKRKKLEQDEARAAAAKHTLQEFEVDDDEDEDDFNPTQPRDDERGDVDDDDDTQSKEQEGEATIEQLREVRASRKAAMQWKQKALEYQKQLNALAEKHEAEKQQLKLEMESQYQSLCDSYEAKMTEVTTQIDDACATGYNEGIQESEAIVASMQQGSESEMNQLKMQIAQLERVAGSGDGSEALAELNRLNEALALKEQVVAALEKQKADLERVVVEKQAALQQALAAGASSSDEATLTELKKETELWKMRAIKMKKAKEQVDAELQKLKDQKQQSGDAVNSAAAEYERGLRDGEARVQDQIQAIGKREFERGVASTSTRYEAQLRELRIQVDRAAAQGGAKAAATYESEVTMLRAEITSLKQQLKLPSDDILANVDAVLDGLASPTVAGTELLDATWGGDTDDTPGGPDAPAKTPDWGEW